MRFLRFFLIFFLLFTPAYAYDDLASRIGRDALLLGLFQENAPDGPVTKISGAGLVNPTFYPEAGTSAVIKKPDHKGIFFPAGDRTIFKTARGAGDTPRILRAGASVFSIDIPENSSKTTHIYAFNHSRKRRMREGENISLVYNAKNKELIATFNHIRKADGALKKIRFRTRRHIRTDGTPNIFAWRRYNGSLQVFLNNHVVTQDEEVTWSHRSAEKRKTRLFHAIGNADGDALTIDSVLFIQKELSTLQWRNLLTWLYQRPFIRAFKDVTYHGGHKPVKNINRHYRHDPMKFARYGAYAKHETSKTRVNTGKASVYNGSEFQTVMKDDFKSNRLASSFRNTIETAVWSAPNFNSAIEMAARPTEPNGPVDKKLRIYDYRHQTLRLGMKYDGAKHYYAGTISTVDQDGGGRYHGGTRRYYLKSRSPYKKYAPDNPSENELAEAYFPAFWGYGIEHLRNRAAPRTEIDWFEWHGDNPYWGNVFINHVHAPVLDAGHPHSDDQPIKLLGALLDAKTTGVPGGINRWDGQIQEHAVTVDEDTGFVYIDYRDARTKALPSNKTNQGWIELVRSKIQPHHLLPFYTIINHALKPYGAKPHELDAFKNATSLSRKKRIAHDYLELFSFKVSYKPKRLNAVPPGFKARPYVTGEIKAGHKIKCVAQTLDADIVLYDWYREDGVPLALTGHDHFTIPDNFNRNIYCKAYSHADPNFGYIEGYSPITD